MYICGSVSLQHATACREEDVPRNTTRTDRLLALYGELSYQLFWVRNTDHTDLLGDIAGRKEDALGFGLFETEHARKCCRRP